MNKEINENRLICKEQLIKDANKRLIFFTDVGQNFANVDAAVMATRLPILASNITETMLSRTRSGIHGTTYTA